jgi:uncharacterized protein YndB with AHSA1/START domain
MRRRIRIAGIVLGSMTAAAAGAVTVETVVAFRASRAERRRALSGDSLVPDPMLTTTQAVTIDAPPERVWPWLAQMGAGRGGWYSWDRIDNGGHPSANSIVPGFQHIAPGDLMPAIPGATDAFVVAAVEPPRDLVLTVPEPGTGTRVSWEFLLEPLDHGHTRLIVRGRVSRRWVQATQDRSASPGGRIFIERVYGVLARLPRPLLVAVGGFGHRVMQNRQLRGIKHRAEA